MGVMDISTPRVKKPMPPMSKMAPNRNRTNVPGSRGAMEMERRNTMAVMGRTEERDSLFFSFSCLFKRTVRPPFKRLDSIILEEEK